MPFSPDRLADVPQYVYRGSYRTKCDDKSSYDYVSPLPSSQTYVGFQWNRFWFVCTTLPFGWKISHIYTIPSAWQCRAILALVVYQPCSLYIDDRLNGELVTPQGPWSVLPENRRQKYRFSVAIAAFSCVLSLPVGFRYTISIAKSVLYPTTSVE